MRLIFFILLFTVTNSFALEKTIDINGYVQLSGENRNLEGAKVIIQDHNNTQNRSYALSDKDGFFSISHTTNTDTLDVIVSYIHHITHFQTIIAQKPQIELDTIVLNPDESLLDAITIIAKPDPITFKGDTVIYNVDSFTTDENANVEQLLEVLPGVLVDADGNITVNGKKVDKIMVDGKPFFGGELTVATRNLSKDMLTSVEVSNSRSKSEAFAEDEGSLDFKTINLVLKEDKKNGVFGEISAGIGLENKYNTNGMFNRFSGDQRTSVMGSANNVNAPRFSGNSISQNQDLLIGSGAGGITTSKNIGLNFSDALSKNIELTGSYLLMDSEIENSSSSSRETSLPESSFFSVGNSESTTSNLNHSLNFGLDFKVNDNLLINLRPSFTLSKNDAISFQKQEQLDADLVPTNYQEQASNSNQGDSQLRNNLSITQKIGKNGGVYKFNFTNHHSQSTRNNANNSTTIVTANPDANTARNQLIENKQKKNNYSANTSYKIPILPKSVFLILGMVYSYTDLRLEQLVDQSIDTGETLPNSDLNMNNIHSNFLPNIELSVKKNKWRASLKSTYLSQSRELVDHLSSANNNKRVFNGISIASNVNYQLNNGMNLNGSYQLQNTPPTLVQVQTFPNVINPLNVIIGNPTLKSAYNHQIRFGLNSYNFEKNSTLFLSSTLDLKKDQIISQLEVDENFFQTTTYVNATGGYNFSTIVNYQKTISLDSLSQLKLEFRANTFLNETPILNYGISSNATSISVMPSVKAGIRRSKWLSIALDYGLSFTQSSFDVSTIPTRQVLMHNAGISANFEFGEHLAWNNSLAGNYNPSISESFQKLNSTWNTSLDYSFMDNKGKLSFVVFDILNMNRSNNKIVTNTFVEESSSLVLTRYIMLSLTWKFSKM